MEVTKLIAVIFGATGFWKLVEILIRQRAEKKIQNAQLKTMNAAAEKDIVENWVQWSQKLEKRLQESEDLNEQMRKKINCLERKVSEVVRKNKELLAELTELKRNKDAIE